MTEFLRRNFRLLSIIALLLVTTITGIAFYNARQLKFDYDFESFFPSGDPDLEVYKAFRDTFEYDNEFILIAIEEKKGIFRDDFLQRLDSVTRGLQQLPDITFVSSPTNYNRIRQDAFGPVKVPAIHLGEKDRYADDSAKVYRSRELVGTLFSTDRKSVCLFAKTTEGISKEKSDVLLTKIEKLLGDQKFDHIRIAGKIKGQKVYLDRLRDEFLVFFISSFILVVLFLWISFRSLWGIWVPIVIVLLSIVWTLGLMHLTGKSLDIMTVLLPTMMFVVGMSDVVHIVTKYLEELREGKDRFDALIITIREAGFATFLTLLTTAIGFLTLINSAIKPVYDFGIYTSIGVFIAFFLSYALMPVVLNSLRTPNLKVNNQTSLFWNRQLHRLLLFVFSKRKLIALGALILLGIAGFGISKIKLNNYLIEGLTRGDSLRLDFEFFEEHYAGVRPFEMVVTVKDSSSTLLSPASIKAIDTLEHYLEKNYGAGYLISPATLIRAAHRAQNGGEPEQFIVPKNDSAIASLSDAVKENLDDKRLRRETKKFLSRDLKTGRISGKMKDIGSLRIRDLNNDLDSFIRSTPALQPLNYRLTGGAMMLDKDNEYLVTNMLQGLALSVLAVALIIALIHRSWRLVIISIIPNLVPIVIIGGVMGYAGIDMKSSTSIIFSIAFGIATDDTIHFLARLKLEMIKGKSMMYALKRTFISTGKAVVVTSLILSAGFLTLVTSGFESTFYFGLLVSVTLLIAVLSDLLLFPLLCIWLLSGKKK